MTLSRDDRWAGGEVWYEVRPETFPRVFRLAEFTYVGANPPLWADRDLGACVVFTSPVGEFLVAVVWVNDDVREVVGVPPAFFADETLAGWLHTQGLTLPSYEAARLRPQPAAEGPAPEGT